MYRRRGILLALGLLLFGAYTPLSQALEAPPQVSKPAPAAGRRLLCVQRQRSPDGEGRLTCVVEEVDGKIRVSFER